jgi:hypothetical protein
MSKRLILVASYPKSGNTWVRLVFDRLKRGSSSGLSINGMDGGWHGGLRRKLFDEFAPVNAADLTAEEIDALSPGVFRQLAADESREPVLKIHDKVRKSALGEWVYPVDCVRSVIYVVRHPYDVAVSTAHHLGISVERAVELMNDDTSIARPQSRLQHAILLMAGSWSANVTSWLDGPYALDVARFEDMHADPVAVFQRLARTAGLADDRDEVRRAVEATRFENLQRQEKALGFRERPETSPLFFRAGRPGTWKDNLDASQQARLARDHGTVMERLGYLPDGGVAQPRP